MSGTQVRSETFLKMYRVLEGMLEKRYAGKRVDSSVVMEYLHDDDSIPFRRELDICREIRNLLSHNADEEGEPLIEPAEAVLEALQKIIDHVSSPKLAVDYGTLRKDILWAHSDDLAIDVMHRMVKNGYSHVPILDHGRIVGVFSAGGLFSYLEKKGLDEPGNGMRIGQLKEDLGVENHGAEKYMFMPEDATLYQVRAAFERRSERNSRLSAIFITHSGDKTEPLIAMLTPWDALKDSTKL